MRAYMETGFYLIYMVTTIVFSILIIVKSKKKLAFLYFGIAFLFLVAGDAFHLIPRAVGLFTNTLDNPSKDLASDLGTGKLITSVTMTIFYVIMYWFIYQLTGKKHNRVIDLVVVLLFMLRIFFCAFPQNGWKDNSYNFTWAFLRNLPFVALGMIVIILALEKLKNRKWLSWMWLLISLSFAFYLPVVFFAAANSWVGLFMLPKTICYIILVIFGYLELRRLPKGEE